MKISHLIVALSTATFVEAFVVPQATTFRPAVQSRLNSLANDDDTTLPSRRDVFQTAIAGITTSALATFVPIGTSAAQAAEEGAANPISNIVVAGATGATGSRIYDRLISQSGLTLTGGVRDVKKAGKSLKGSLKHLDVVEDSLDSLTSTLEGADALVIACGFNPGKNLLKMAAAAHAVDNVGTCKLIDAASKAGVKKVVMVSSILTNGRSWGQEDSAGFKITNAFGNSLDEKLVAENYLRKSGLDYTIVRPGGLQNKAPAGALSINPEDTLNSGEISRDLVADVVVASLTDAKASNKVLEIIEDTGVPPKVFNGLVM